MTLTEARFRTELSVIGRHHVVALAGEFDLSDLGEVEAALREAEAAAPERIILDLSELTFIDSTGIAFLVEAVRRHESDDDLRIKPSDAEAVRKVLSMTGVDDYLPYLSSAEAPLSGNGARSVSQAGAEDPGPNRRTQKRARMPLPPD